MKLKTLLLATATAAALMAAPAQAATLRWAAQNDILTLDPHSQNHSTTNAISMHAYEGLTRYDAQYRVEPALATKWTFLSPTQVRFELRKGVKFHYGKEMGPVPYEGNVSAEDHVLKVEAPHHIAREERVAAAA